MSAQLKRSNSKRLACTVRLIDHRLDYSPSGIDEPAEDKRRHRKQNVSAILQTTPRARKVADSDRENTGAPNKNKRIAKAPSISPRKKPKLRTRNVFSPKGPTAAAHVASRQN